MKRKASQEIPKTDGEYVLEMALYRLQRLANAMRKEYKNNCDRDPDRILRMSQDLIKLEKAWHNHKGDSDIEEATTEEYDDDGAPI